MKISEVGEFPLIDRLVARFPPGSADVRVGPGDDVAAIDLGGGRWLLATADTQVAGVHFLEDRIEPRRLGRRAVAVNLSDIAAAGGRPLHVLLSLVLPAETTVAFVDELAAGVAEECARHGVDVVGGNVSRGPTLTVDVTLLGEVAAGAMLCRDGARPGDRILLTGRVGAAAAGLLLARDPRLGTASEAGAVEEARRAFETPSPRVEEGLALVRAGGVTAAIDVSDGLAADLSHICDRSAVGVRIDGSAIPVAPSARAIGTLAGIDPLDLAIGGGEDYELLFTARGERVRALADAVERCGTACTEIGEVVEATAGRTVRFDDRDRPLLPAGFKHW